MADKSAALILDALTKAMADPGGVPLHGKKKSAGLFASSAGAKQAAQHCLEEGFLRVRHRETIGKRVQDVCTLTEKGLAYVLSQTSPKQVLEELVRALQAQQAQVAELVAATRQWQAGLDALQTAVSKVLQQSQQTGHQTVRFAPSNNGSATEKGDCPFFGTLTADLVACLTQWQASGASGDCPLPELYARVQPGSPSLTIGHFHDSLRHLHGQEKIYLHPWSGPLYEIPEPPYTLLVGHEVAYYASIRRDDRTTR